MPVPACRGRPECQKDRSRTHTQAGDGLSLDLRTFYQGQNKTPPKISGVCQQSDAPWRGAFSFQRGQGGLLLHQPRKLLLEARHATATVDELLLAAGPGRVRLRVDIKVQGVALL